MVFTRNQKRTLDTDNENENELENLNKIHGNLNIKIKKKKKHIDEDDESDSVYLVDEYVYNTKKRRLEQVVKDKCDANVDTDSNTDTDSDTEYIQGSTQTDTDVDASADTESKTELELGEITETSDVTLKETNATEEPESSEDKVYKKFINYVDKIYSGDFFNRISPDDKISTLKKHYPSEKIEEFTNKLVDLHNVYKKNTPSVSSILQMDVHDSVKSKLLEKIHHLANAEILSSEYNSNMKYLLTNINKTQDRDLYELEQQIIKSAQADEYSDDYRKKILKSKMPFNNKVIAYKRLEVMERYEESDSSEFAKYKNWMDILLSIPFDEYKTLPSENTSVFIKTVRETLDKRLSFLEKPKDQIINVVTQMLRNPDFTINAIGLWGNKGLGKTAICKSIAEALGRPLKVISLGGESDSSVLSGHNFTYVGSAPGRLIEILNESKCMNPVILFDEIDKVSQTQHGKEIIGNLIHLTDKTTNEKYNYDRYFSGIEFDLSKVLFIFTYNEPENVDRILADRLYKIKVDNYTLKEKLEITNQHLIKNILEEYKFTVNDISFEQSAIEYVVNNSKSDQGMRDIKRKFEIIVSRINTLLLTNGNPEIIKLKYKSLAPEYQSLPVIVKKDHVDTLLENSITSDTTTTEPPFGMYI